jgi:urea transport system substrate-binding protein
MAISERAVVDAALLAIEELNEAGGLLGRHIEAVVADGRSDAATFAVEAERLITQDRVAAIFGCWTSASRRTVRPVIERLEHLLFYPVQYEGLEESRHVIYLGAAPNQQIIPAVKWSLDHMGQRFFLVGSDYVFPRAANAIIRDQVAALRGQVVGEEYALLGSNDVGPMIARIKETRPDMVLNTLNGGTNLAFFRGLRAAGFSADDLPVLSFSIGENELATLPAAEIAGHYAAWNYFQSVPGEQNRAFVARVKRRYGSDRVTSDPMEAAYVGVHLWAQAVEEAGTTEVRAVRDGIRRQSRNAPEGPVYIDPDNGHTWRVVRIGRIREDGLFDIVWSSGTPIRPAPFPPHRTKAAWLEFLGNLQQGWGGAWANPGVP